MKNLKDLSEKELLFKGAGENLLPHYAMVSEIREKGPKILSRGEGALLWDIDGKEYIDGHSILWVANIGHGRKEIAEAAAAQMEKLAYGSLFGGYYNEPAIKLAMKLAQIAPGDLNAVFLVSGGSEAVEAAIKIARQYQQRKGYPNRYKVISRRESYHGVTFGALSATGLRIYRTPFEPLVPGFVHVPAPYCYHCDYGKEYPNCEIECADAIEDTILWEGPKSVAAVIGEPVMSAAGVLAPPKEYWEKVRAVCNKYEILLIADEVINAFGRTGKFFACEHYGIIPDIMTFAKAMSGGYAPIGAAVVSKKIADEFVDWMFVHGITYGGHPVSATCAMKNIEILEREKLPGRAAEMGKYLLEGLNSLKSHKIVGDVRAIGLHSAIEYVKDKKTREPLSGKERAASKIEELSWQRGLYLCRASVDKTYVAPPLIIEKKQIEKIVSILDEAIGIAEKDIK